MMNFFKIEMDDITAKKEKKQEKPKGTCFEVIKDRYKLEFHAKGHTA